MAVPERVTCLRDTQPLRMLMAAMASIGENIKAARTAAGIKTQGGLARKMGVPQPQMSDWENNRYVPDLSTLLRIAAAIPCDLDALVQGIDTRYDESRAARDLLGQGGGVQTGSLPPGEPDGPASDRARRLESRLQEYDGLVPDLERITQALVRVAAKRAEDAAATRSTPGRRRRDRKTG